MIAGAGLGLVIGVLLGLLGGGGSILAVPALVYGAGVPLAAAVPMSLLVVGVSSATALLPRLRNGQVAWRIAGVFGAAGAAAAFAGAAVNRLLDPRVVLAGFAALMVAAAVRMLREQVPTGGDCALPGGGVNWRGCLPKAIGSGLAVGFLTGLFGVGGGFLIIPALVLLLGLPMTVAVGTSLLIVVVNSAAGFAALMVAAAVRMLREQVPVGGDCALPGGGVNWRGCLPKAIGSGLAVGFLTGLFGVGGGFLIIPALVLLLGLPMTVAVGTSLLIVVVNSAAGFAAHAGDTPLDYRLTAVFTLAAVAGSVLAAPLATRLPADRLRRWFAYLVMVIAAFVVAQALLNPAAAAG